MDVVTDISDRIVVLNSPRERSSPTGRRRTMLTDDRVTEAYLE